ncbi:hypothetical protein [Glycomyces tenuis]|uniref:hypothetical protein n=1 Tax=Glycomyces tenuis TaxID=58116 RepID=UPI00042685DD|nr:hypothetical protein [Glycomyces tenuis]
MVEKRTRAPRTPARWAACGGLLLCAAGVAVLWLSGVEFPVALPSGGENTDSSSRSEIVFLLIGTLFVAFAPWRWAPLVGALLGAAFTIGFAATPAGIENLFGGEGAGVAAAQGVQLLGALAALLAGIAATRAGYARVTRTSGS